MPAQTVIQIRRDTAANWESTDPTLASGEIGFDTTNNQIKIGNGSDEWTVLDYASGGASVQISETAPVDPDEGNVWFNSTDGRAYIYYDSTWVDLNPGIAGPAGKFTVSETEPADPAVGDGWFNSGTARLFIYYDNFWVEATSNYIGPTGEPGIVVQTSAPTDTDVLWLDSDDPADAVAVPAGGSTGQVLAKATGDDYDTEWTSLREPPSGNAIINGAFDIWQRGTSGTASSGNYGYGPDRFATFSYSGTSGSWSQQTFTPGTAPVAGYEGQYFARFTSTNTGTIFRQPIEDVRSFAGQTVTLSFWMKAASATSLTSRYTQEFGSGGSAAVDTGSTVHSITTSWARYTATVTIPSVSGKTIGAGSSLRVIFDTTAINNAIDIWGVQLEAGSSATAFRRNANSLQGELAACQRYYQNTFTGSGKWYSTTVAQCYGVFPVQMRVAPTLGATISGAVDEIGVSERTITGITSSGMRSAGGFIAITTATATNNAIAGVYGINVQLSAEL
jgi:hypothetical protein